MENFTIFLFFGNPACSFFFFKIRSKTKGNDKYAQSARQFGYAIHQWWSSGMAVMAYQYVDIIVSYMHIQKHLSNTCMVIHGFIFLTLMSWQSHLLHNSLMEMRYHLPHPFSSYISCQTCCSWRSTKADSKVQEANQKF